MPWLICNIGKNRAIKKYNIEFNNFYNPYKQPLLKELGNPSHLSTNFQECGRVELPKNIG